MMSGLPIDEKRKRRINVMNLLGVEENEANEAVGCVKLLWLRETFEDSMNC